MSIQKKELIPVHEKDVLEVYAKVLKETGHPVENSGFERKNRSHRLY